MANPVFVCGATGTQGGFVARHLRKANIPVHALVRDPSSPKAKALESIGVILFPGSWEDKETLIPALKGTTSAFLNFMPSFTDARQELRDTETVLTAAKSAGVKHIVYSGIFKLEQMMKTVVSDLDPNGLPAQIYRAKVDVDNAVVSAGFGTYTILLPGKFMSDFYGPAAIWFGTLSKTGVFETALRKGQGVPFVDPDDIGAFAAAALTNPEKFAGQRVEVNTEILTVEEAITMLSEALGKKLSVRYMSDEEVEEKRKDDIFLQAQVTTREIAGLGSLDGARSYGVPVGSFRNFLEREMAALKETYSEVPDVD